MLGLSTLNALGNFTIDRSADTSTVVILQGALPAASVAVSDPRTRVVTDFTVAFTLSSRNFLPEDARIVVTFDARMDVSGVGEADGVVVSGMDGTLTASVAGQLVTRTPHPKPETRNPKLETAHPSTFDPQPSTLNPQPQTR